MADPMDYTMDDGHAQRTPNPAQCQYQQPQHSPNSNAFVSHSRDTHHYDPVHNTESWHGSGNGSHIRPAPPYSGSANIAQLSPSITYAWQGIGEVRRGSQGLDGSYHQSPAYAGGPHSSWADDRSYEPQAGSFGYFPGMYGENSSTNNPGNAGRSSLAASTQSQGSRRYPSMSSLPDDYARRARMRNDTLRAMNAQIQALAEPETSDLPSPLQISSGHDHTRTHTRSDLYSRRQDSRDWDSEDEEDPLGGSFAELRAHANPYRAYLSPNGAMGEERRLAAARGAAMAARKSVPSKEFVASLEKLKPSDLKEPDRTCMICYNEFGIENPDGFVEQPVRLPKCKHVFGDKCIKKWFEDSDSCPYCRDKLPSEPVRRKHPAYDQLYLAAHARRVHMAAQAAAQAQAQGPRSRAYLSHPSRASEPGAFENNTSSEYFTHSPEDYHYLMRGSGALDTWSSPSNRSRETENRRRQGRGRASLIRPTSIGSARLVVPGPSNAQNLQRTHLQSIAPNTLSSGSSTAPRRSITPGLTRQHSTGSVPTAVTPPRTRLQVAEVSSPASVEVSPPVAVGSGVVTGDRNSSPSESRGSRDWNTWRDNGNLLARLDPDSFNTRSSPPPPEEYETFVEFNADINYPRVGDVFDFANSRRRWAD